MQKSLLRTIRLFLELTQSKKMSINEQSILIASHCKDFAAQKFTVALMRAKTSDEADRLEQLFAQIYGAPERSIYDSILDMWVIYKNPSDRPTESICARLHTSNGPTDQLIEGTIESLRERFSSQGFVNIGRNVNDDPVIMEVWL